MNRRNFNFYDDRYDIYYLSQANQQNQFGDGLESEQLSFYRGKPWQRGFGNIFSRFGEAYGIPLLKYFGKKLFNYGLDVANDVNSGENLKESLKKNLKRKANVTLDDVKSKIQQGQSRSKKVRNNRKKTRERKQYKKKRSINSTEKVKKSSKRRNKSKNIFDHYV